MTPPRIFIGLLLSLTLLAVIGCSPADPRTRVDEAMATLRSASDGADKATACRELRSALAAYPVEAADREALIQRAVPLFVGALRDRSSRSEAEEALVQIGMPSYEALFDAAIDADAATQEGAVVCLVRMSGTAVPVLLPALLGDDIAAQDRAARVLIRIGEPISATLRDYHRQFLEQFTDAGATTEPSTLSARGKAGMLAFARVFGAIGDQLSVITLIEGCDTLHRPYPDLGSAYLRIVRELGPEAIRRIPASHQLTYERLQVVVGAP